MSGKFYAGTTLGLAAFICAASPAFATESQAYTYDALGRLVKVQSTGTVNNNRVRSFCYDKVGNRIEFDSNATGTPAACVTQG